MRLPALPTLFPLLLLSALASTGTPGAAQITKQARRLPLCKPTTAIEFISPMPAEEIPNFHGLSPTPDSWTIVLEISLDQNGPPFTPVFEGTFVPPPGATAPQPTDVNGDTILGDPHPAFPGLQIWADDDLLFNGFVIPAGTNLSSFVELIGSEKEHGGSQSTTVTWLLDPFQYFLVDLNGDLGTNLFASLNGKTDTVFVRHGWDPLNMGVLSTHTPTISIWTEDWISTIDSDVPSNFQTPFLVCVEVRIPCTWDSSTTPPSPVPLDPIFGPCFGGTMACTGTFPPMAGPGFHPMFPSLDVRFSDDYMDTTTGTFVPGGVITGGQCGVIWGSTGASLAYAFRQASVHAWYGVNGVIDTTPLGGGDDQMIYRFVMIADGMIFDTDILPQEMMITAAVESTTNCFSITNVRVKHRPNVFTRNP